MGVLRYDEVSGLGYADAIIAAIGSLANAGANVYQTVEMSKATKGQQKLQTAALQIDAELRRREQDLIAKQQEQQGLAQKAKTLIASENIRTGIQIGGAVLLGIGALWAIFGGRRG